MGGQGTVLAACFSEQAGAGKGCGYQGWKGSREGALLVSKRGPLEYNKGWLGWQRQLLPTCVAWCCRRHAASGAACRSLLCCGGCAALQHCRAAASGRRLAASSAGPPGCPLRCAALRCADKTASGRDLLHLQQARQVIHVAVGVDGVVRAQQLLLGGHTCKRRRSTQRAQQAQRERPGLGKGRGSAAHLVVAPATAAGAAAKNALARLRPACSAHPRCPPEQHWPAPINPIHTKRCEATSTHAKQAPTRQHQHGGQPAVLPKQDVCVEAVPHHADLPPLQPKLVGDVGQHELGGLAHHGGLALGGACEGAGGAWVGGLGGPWGAGQINSGIWDEGG